MLHITNGDSVADMLHASSLPGNVMPWRDVLHEGPVPAGLNLAALDGVRAAFLAGYDGVDVAEVRQGFNERRQMLHDSLDADEVILWFEHDLYDQLQLIQVLDWFAAQTTDTPPLSLICINAFPGIERFRGLGQLQPEDLESLFGNRVPVPPAQLALGRRAWAAFRSPDPQAIESLLAEDTSALPFLAAALRRHLEQFPSTTNGLGRTQQQILTVLATGTHEGTALFRACDALEEAPFLGDLVFWEYAQRLAEAPVPLLALDPRPTPSLRYARLTLTEAGSEVLKGHADHIELNGVDGWWGGVQMQGHEARWRWDGAAGHLRRTA